MYSVRQERNALKVHRVVSLCLLCLTLFSLLPIQNAYAQVELEQDRGSFTVKNLSEVNLVGVTRGERSIGVLLSGDSWSAEAISRKDLFDEEIPLTLDGRIEIGQWVESLNDLPGSSTWARLQLTTAGFDVNRGSLMSSLLGSEHKRSAIRALREWTPTADELGLDRASALKLGLLAYASRYTSTSSLLTPLLKRVRPLGSDQSGSAQDISTTAQWGEGYEQLPSTLSSLRQAIEIKGAEVLPVILRDPEWAQDRGFEQVELAFALLPEIEVINALKERGDLALAVRSLKQIAAEATYSRTNPLMGPQAALPHLEKMIEARQEGDQRKALSMAISTVLMWRRNRLAPEFGQTTRVICNYLTTSAQREANQKRLLAAQALLNLSRDVCFGRPSYREATAELMRVRGDLEAFELNLDDALQWYRSAVWINHDLVDRVRLIDTLSRIAVREMARRDYKKAQSYLKEARNLETPEVPIRESLVVATKLMPTPDRRSQVGMIILIVVLAIGALSQILRVLFGRKR